MNVHALRHAGVGGVADRGRQAAARAFDRFVLTLQPRTPSWPVPAHLVPDPRAVPRDAERGQFFAGTAEDPAPFAERFPLARDRALFAAQAIVDGRFDLLGYRALEFGSPIVWHLDPVAQRAAPLCHWSDIDALDHDAVGDSKVIWELNRQQWLIELGQAWRLSGDPRYAQAFVDAVSEWMAANPPGIGINWSSSLEVSIRAISWSWALHLFRGAPQLTDSFTEELLAWTQAHALHVERYLSWYFSPNTHLTGEALGLFHIGVAFPSLDGAKRWRRAGARILLTELDRQVHADGGHFELATCYHRYTIEMYLHFLILARRNRIAVPERVATRVMAMLDWLLDVCAPDGTMPSIGDDDGGSWWHLAPRERGDVRGVFSVAAALFGRADYARAAGGLQPETWWLLGDAGCRAFDALAPTAPSRAPSRLLADSGYAVMRSDWSAQANHAIVDVGALGCSVSAAHGHADLLSLQLSVHGTPLIVDPGTGRYVADGWRDWFRSSGAHSTVTVDSRSQAQPRGLFAWRERPGARVRAWRSTAAADFVDAEHDAYPVTHRRRVAFVKPGFWLVVDDLVGDTEAEHRFDLRFQFAPGTTLSARRDAAWWRAQRGDTGVWIRSLAAADLVARDDDGWVSDAYGQREAARALSVSTSARAPLRILTLIAAGDAASPPGAWVRRRSHAADVVEAAGLRFTVTDADISYERGPR